MSTIKTWVERLPDGVRFCPSTTEMIPVMREEIAELRAALAASGGNAAPGLTDEQIDEICNVQEAKYGQLCDTEDMRMFARAIEAASAPNAALVAALQNLLHLADEFGIQSGVCCCGDDMKRHGNPMDCGHSPVDSGEYYTASAIEEARKALSAAGQEVGHG